MLQPVNPLPRSASLAAAHLIFVRYDLTTALPCLTFSCTCSGVRSCKQAFEWQKAVFVSSYVLLCVARHRTCVEEPSSGRWLHQTRLKSRKFGHNLDRLFT